MSRWNAVSRLLFAELRWVSTHSCPDNFFYLQIIISLFLVRCPFKENSLNSLYHGLQFSDLRWAAPHDLFLYPCSHCCWVLFEFSRVQGYLFDINQGTFISPAFWKPFMFSFSFCPHFIHYVSQTHTALSAFCCCCRWLFTTKQQIAFCWVLLH